MLTVTDARQKAQQVSIIGRDIPANTVFFAMGGVFYKTQMCYIFHIGSGQAYSGDARFLDYLPSKDAELIIR